MKAPVRTIIGYDLDFYEYLPKLFPHTDAKSWFEGKPKKIEETAFRNGTLQGAYLIMARGRSGWTPDRCRASIRPASTVISSPAPTSNRTSCAISAMATREAVPALASLRLRRDGEDHLRSPMNILALDTSMGACSAAVLRAGAASRDLFARETPMARGHAEALMPMIAEVMEESRLDFPALDLIAATTGPGSFTGVRIAIAAARGLALVTPAKLYGTDSLTVMARSARATRDLDAEPFAVAVDARRGTLYLGLYDGAGRKLDGPLLIAPDDAVGLLPKNLQTVVGSGGPLLAEAAAGCGRQLQAVLPELQSGAPALAEIARESGETDSVLRPLYLRPPDARPQAAAVARR
jgi:tRNA threonylcarbamoyladenosine biosynthesis protein TsaB